MAKFSIIICTHNGRSTLPKVFEHLSRIEVPDGGAEVLVVDNASRDGVSETVPEAVGSLAVRLLREERVGKTYALNLALSVVMGEFLVFIDDDILVSENWLTGYASAVSDDRHIFAGQVRQYWSKTPPEWLKHLEEAGRAFGTTPTSFNTDIAPIHANLLKGGNFMVRSSAIGDIQFDSERFGYDKKSAGGEDTQFAREVSERNGPVWFVPDACVQHIARPDEISMAGVFKRSRRIGAINHVPLSSLSLWSALKLVLRSSFVIAKSSLGPIAISLGSNSRLAAFRFVRFSREYGRLFGVR